jgi:hypothetical protein
VQTILIYFGNTIAMVFLLAAVVALLLVTRQGHPVYWFLCIMFCAATIVDLVKSYRRYLSDRNNASGTF